MYRLRTINFGNYAFSPILLRCVHTSKYLAANAELKLENEHKPISRENAKPFSEIPGPRGFSALRNFLPGGKFYNCELLELTVRMRKEYGDLILLQGFFGKPDIIITFNPEDFEIVYRMEGPWPNRIEFATIKHYRNNVRPDTYRESTGLLIEQGEKWKELRGIVNPVMMQPRIAKQYVKPVEEIADEFIEKLLKSRDANNELPNDFKMELNKWSLESIGCIALNSRLGCLRDDATADSDSHRMIQSIHEFIELIYQLEVLPSIWQYVRTPKYYKLMKALDTITDISMKKIDEAIERSKNYPNGNLDRETSVLEKLYKINRNVAVVMAIDMLTAGIDTVNFIHICNADVLSRDKSASTRQVEEELKTILPDKNSKLTNESFNHVPYLRACMKESSRIIPIASGTMRKTPVDLVLSGYQIPKGTEISINHATASRDSKHFLKPMEFIPERWLSGHDSQGCPSTKSAHPFVHMPFGFGPRSCIGKRFADLEVETLISKLFRNHKIEWNYGELEVACRPLTTPVSPLKFKVTEL